jgi:hypothetical protein
MTTKKKNIEQAIQAVTSVASGTDSDKNQVPQKMICIRINASDYNRLCSLFASQGTKMTAAMRAAIFRLGELVEAGDMSIPNGVIRDHRRRVDPNRDYMSEMPGRQREGIHGIFTQTSR